jgi:hypothetical protein
MVVVANRASAASERPSYPASWEFDGLLTNGAAVLVRPIRPEDATALARFHVRLSPESIQYRFFAAHPTLTTLELARFTTVDYRERMAFVAIVAEELAAFASYDRL